MKTEDDAECFVIILIFNIHCCIICTYVSTNTALACKLDFILDSADGVAVAERSAAFVFGCRESGP